MTDQWAHLNDPPYNARQRRDYEHGIRLHDAAFDPECFGCRMDYNGPRCANCGEPLYGDLAEVTVGLATDTPLPSKIVHAECIQEGEHLA